MPKPQRDIVAEIELLFEGRAAPLETCLREELDDPASVLTPGQLMRVAGALTAAADVLSSAAKNLMLGVTHHEDAGVVFTWRGPHTQVRLNSQEVKAKYPEAVHPTLYQNVEVKGAVVASLPYEYVTEVAE